MFTRQYAERLLDELLGTRSESDEAEAKSGLGVAFQEALCAMANRRDRNGGIVFLGIAKDFSVSGVADVSAAQKQVTDWASDLFNVPLRVTPELLERDGKAVLAVIVPACPAGQRPCHFRRHGPLEGAWVRVGNSRRRMTVDEARRLIAEDEINRGSVLPYDMTPFPRAGIGDLDEALIRDYVERVRRIRPSSHIQRLSQLEVLRSVNGVAELEGKAHPTPAGLLFFCREPQRYLPQSSVEFLHLWGPELTSLGPDGSRSRLDREFFGTLPRIIDEMEATILERVATRGIIDGFRRRDEPEYPRFALREVIVNAVAHRDYTMRGSRIQIRLYPDRLEVHTPGGLPAPVTVDNIEDEQATRNEAIVSLLQDYGYMERRGYGFDEIVASMREAGMAPPLLTDNGASFNLCLKSHVLMSPEALTWLRQFEGFELGPQERLALAYLRVNERLYNRDYARLSSCTSTEATQALRRMVEKGAIAMRSTRGGAYYVLPESLPEPPTTLFDPALSDEERILRLARREGKVTTGLCVDKLGLPGWRVYRLIRHLVERGNLEPHGSGRWRYYTPNQRPYQTL